MTKSTVVACPACASKKKAPSIGEYNVCSYCHMMYLPKVVNSNYLKKNIENDGKWIVADENNSAILQIHKDRLRTVSRYIKKNSSILDVGCGKGQFISLAKKRGYKAVAMDKSQSIVNYIHNDLKIPAYVSLRDIKEQFDVVTSFDVIEHTTYPKEFIDEISKKLQKNGILMITTPNAKGISAKILGKYWWAFGPEGHFNLFTVRSLQILLEEKGFAILQARTNTLTQWLPVNKNILERVINKVIYVLFNPFQGWGYSHMLGDNLEIIAQKI